MRKSTICLDIIEALKTEVPGLKYIDKNWGQLFMEHPPVGWPCALIDIDEIEFQELGDNEHAEVAVVLTVADKRASSGSANAPEQFKTKSVSVLDLTDDIHIAMMGISPEDDYTKFRAKNFFKDYSVPGVECYKMRYVSDYDNELIPEPEDDEDEDSESGGGRQTGDDSVDPPQGPGDENENQ